MGRKKKKFKPIIFCYYCDRTFENEKVLIQHQRAKHFKCIVCHKRLGSAHGMMVHVFQVHKQQIDKVPHAKEGRDSFHVDIFGMSNIPQDIIAAKHAERGEPPAKRQKVENQQKNPLIVNNVNVNVHQQQPQMQQMQRPMYPNPMMMNPMMNPMMMNMNPMMMGMHRPMQPFNPYMPAPPPPHMQMAQVPHAPYMQPPPQQNGMYPPQPHYPQPPHRMPPQPQHPQTLQMPQPQQPQLPPPQPQLQPQQQGVINNNAVNEVNNGHLNGVIDEKKECVKEAVGANNVTQKVNVVTKKNKKTILLYDDELISMEEKRFMHSDYHWTPKQKIKSDGMKNEEIEMDKTRMRILI